MLFIILLTKMNVANGFEQPKLLKLKFLFGELLFNLIYMYIPSYYLNVYKIILPSHSSYFNIFNSVVLKSDVSLGEYYPH